MRLLLSITVVLALTGCELLQGMSAELPSISYNGASLVQSPSQQQMAGYYCPQVVPDPFGISGSAAILCSGFFGAKPTQQQMQVGFQTRYSVKNPNQFPIPVAEMLWTVAAPVLASAKRPLTPRCRVRRTAPR